MPENNTSRSLPFFTILVLSIFVSIFAGGAAGYYFGQYGGSDSMISGSPFEQMIHVEEDSATIDAVEKVRSSVVSVVVTKDVSALRRRQSSLFDDFFFGVPGFDSNRDERGFPKDLREVGGGSGFVISDDGLILTNRHVVDDTDAQYSVLTSEGEEFEADVLALDPVLDLAVLKISVGDADLRPVQLGDSDDLQIGQTVIAIGNALGEFQNSVTKGIISGVERNIVAGGFGSAERIEAAIQTDAAINAGNSGGPLVDLSGRVVGINTAVSGRGQSIGFTIPINEAKRVIESVKENGRIVRPFLGVRYLILNEDIAAANGMDVSSGALIVRGDLLSELAVVPGSPADKVGLEENDIILEVDGKAIDESYSLARALARYTPGEEVELKVYHDGEERVVSVVLDDFDDE